MQEQIPNNLPPIKITITPDDFKSISNALKELPVDERQRLSEVIRNQEVNYLSATDREFISAIAYFAKITTKYRDKDLIKNTLFLDDPDIAYLIEEVAPPNGLIEQITSYTIINNSPNKTTEPANSDLNSTLAAIKEFEQDDLFPDCKSEPPPTLAVTYNERHTRREIHNIAISKVAQEITKVLNRELTPIRVSPYRAKAVYTNITLAIDLEENPEYIKLACPITFFDRIVEDAIGNLYEQGYTKITADMIYRQINGLKGADKVSDTAAARIERSITRLARTWIEIDYTQQAQVYLKQPVKKAVMKDHIVPAKNIYIQFPNGTIKSGWLIKELPQIYSYSKTIKQIATVPTALLDTKDATRSTDKMIDAKYYLIAQIERIRRKPQNSKILYDSLFDAIGDNVKKKNRDIRLRRIEYITKMLDHFKNQKYIADYTPIIERGGRIQGVTITMPLKENVIEGNKQNSNSQKQEP